MDGLRKSALTLTDGDDGEETGPPPRTPTTASSHGNNTNNNNTSNKNISAVIISITHLARLRKFLAENDATAAAAASGVASPPNGANK